MEVVGRTTIHPAVFYSGKVAGYLLWLLLGLDYAGVHLIPGFRSSVLRQLSSAALVVGLAFIVLSALGLGRSVRLGLPTGETELKTGGVYRISRNPMYVGFDALTLAAVLRSGNPIVLVFGVYSVVVYHLIIRGEERFLASAFGDAYERYRARVRRYV